MVLDPKDKWLIAVVQDGLPMVARPYQALAQRLGMSEAEVIGRLNRMLDEGVIKRFGVVVRHRALGYRANAMVVWDVPDDEVDVLGERLGQRECVSLCYRRPRRPPLWPYNLFCMIHGRARETVLASLDEIISGLGLAHVPHAVLFSRRAFKQCGARYVDGPLAQREVANG